MKNYMLKALIGIAIVFGGVPAAMATLIGTTVTIDTFQDGNFREGAIVVPDGTPTAEAFFAPFFDYNVENDFIDLTCAQGTFCNNGSNGFTYRVDFGGLDWGGLGSLTGAQIDPLTSCPACNASISGLSASGFSLNFGPESGWQVASNDFVRISLTSTHNVPEPTAFALLGLGLLCIGLARGTTRFAA